MSFNEKIQQISRLDQMIRLKMTGTATELSARLGISERSVFDILRTMKEMGAPIYYNSNRKSYCYEEDVHFQVGFFDK